MSSQAAGNDIGDKCNKRFLYVLILTCTADDLTSRYLVSDYIASYRNSRMVCRPCEICYHVCQYKTYNSSEQ